MGAKLPLIAGGGGGIWPLGSSLGSLPPSPHSHISGTFANAMEGDGDGGDCDEDKDDENEDNGNEEEEDRGDSEEDNDEDGDVGNDNADDDDVNDEEEGGTRRMVTIGLRTVWMIMMLMARRTH